MQKCTGHEARKMTDVSADAPLHEPEPVGYIQDVSNAESAQMSVFKMLNQKISAKNIKHP